VGGGSRRTIAAVEGPDPARAAYLDYLARCEQAFNPFAPIELPEFFAGRVKHIEKLQAELSAPGRQVAIYGERGVGKTSLAQLAYFFVGRDEERTHLVRCQKSSTFDTIFADVLASAGLEVLLDGVGSEAERHGSVGFTSVGIGGTRRVRRTFRKVNAGRQIGPRLLLGQFAEREGLVIIDEYDRVADPQTHTRMAELIKQFSDARSRCKIILVGVAETLSQLIGEHESLSRSLAQIELDRMSDDELGDIIAKGQGHLHLAFKPSVKQRIIRLADGFPYFVHLIGRHSARAAGRELLQDPTATMVAGDEEYAEGLQEALENAEHTLAEQYEQAIVTTRRPSGKFMLILWAMALADARHVQVQDIAKNAGFFGETDVKAASFSWNLGELSSERRGQVITKVREGYYKFTNPLMRPYIRSIMELENVLYRGKQWDFPFMHGA